MKVVMEHNNGWIRLKWHSSRFLCDYLLVSPLKYEIISLFPLECKHLCPPIRKCYSFQREKIFIFFLLNVRCLFCHIFSDVLSLCLFSSSSISCLMNMTNLKTFFGSCVIFSVLISMINTLNT